MIVKERTRKWESRKLIISRICQDLSRSLQTAGKHSRSNTFSPLESFQILRDMLVFLCCACPVHCGKTTSFFDEKLLLCFSVLSDTGDDEARNRTNDEGCGFQSWKPPQRKIQICRSEPLTAPSSEHVDHSTCC